MKLEGSSLQKVYWIGPPDPSVYVPKLAHKECYFYKKCIYGPMTLKTGDFVLISSAGSVDSDSVESCEIARIIRLYEVEGDTLCQDPYQAIVQWYSRPEKIPHKLFDDDTVCLDFSLEIVEDHRSYDPVIAVDTIFRKCIVVCGDPLESAASLMPKGKSMYPMFVCRYKIVKVRGGHQLIPLNDKSGGKETSLSKTPKYDTSQHTPKSTCKKHSGSKRPKINEMEFVDVNQSDTDESKSIVSPIKIVRNSIIKMKKNSTSKIKNKTPGKVEVNANYLPQSPEINHPQTTLEAKLNGARRNLNISLEANSTADSDLLNYSIIKNSPNHAQSELKIKLRLSDCQKDFNLMDLDSELSTFSPSLRKTRRTSIDTQVKIHGALVRSSRKRSLCENIENTPTRSSRESSVEKSPTSIVKICETPRRKSILKTPSGRQSLAECTAENIHRRLTTIRTSTKHMRSSQRKNQFEAHVNNKLSAMIQAGTPKRNIQLSNIVEEVVFNGNSSLAESNRTNTPRRSRKINNVDYLDDESNTPRRKTPSSSSKSTTMTPTQKLKLIRSGAIMPTIDAREKSSGRRKSDLQVARERLHVSAVPQSLPCREQEFHNIYTFLEGKIQDQCGGCMYISGVPGTGKTATVTGVIRSLKRDVELDNVPEFDFIEINGMRLTEPRQAYVQIYKQLTGKTVTWEHAQSLLEKRFTTAGPRRMTTVLLVDELDILCNRRQDVVYNLLDWPTKSTARLIVVTIANTMDLPERMLMSKVTSRLGLTRLTFQPYSHKQLQEIVTARLSDSQAFKGDAIQLVARKVAAVSGDARRALDICRRATEIAEESTKEKTVSMSHVQQALGEMISSAKVQAIKNCSKLEQLFLQAVAAEVTRTGVEETTYLGVYTQFEAISAFMGVSVPVPGRALKICAKLGAERLLICEHSRTDIFQKILLNVSTDDIHYALQLKNH